MCDMSALHTVEKYKLSWNRLHIDPSRYESLRISLQLDSIVFTGGCRNLMFDSLAGMFVLTYCILLTPENVHYFFHCCCWILHLCDCERFWRHMLKSKCNCTVISVNGLHFLFTSAI